MKKYYYRYFILSVTLAMFVGCQHDDDLAADEHNDEIETVENGLAQFILKPFELGEDGVEGALDTDSENTQEANSRNRVTFKLSGNVIKAFWDKENKIGVYPIKNPNSQIQYKFEAVAGTDSVTGAIAFTGSGWGLQTDNTYAAYYPYRDVMGSTGPDEVPIRFSGQKQVGNNNLDSIGLAYDYMYSNTTVPENGVAKFTFNQAISLFKFQLCPKAIGKWTKLVLTNAKGDQVFADSATMNVSTGKIAAINYTTSLSLKLENISTTSTDEYITLYVATMPSEDPGTLLVELHGTNGSYSGTYANTIADKALVAGKYRSIKMEVKSSIHTYTDLGLPSGNMWALNNLGATMPYDHGYYYGWGEIQPSDSYYWNTYRYSYNRINVPDRAFVGSTNADLYRYTFDDGFTKGAWYDESGNFRGDGKKQLELTPATPWIEGETTDDAAQNTWGGDWQVPTAADYQELLDNCTFSWTENYKESGVNGYVVTSKTNGRQIFFPAGGWVGKETSRDTSTVKMYQDEDGFYHQQDGFDYNNSGYYWTADLSDSYSFDAKELKFVSQLDNRGETKLYKPVITSSKRYFGASIRPVIHTK